MTGVGLATGETPLGPIEVEIRSVNGRGLSVKARMSGPCQGMDGDLEPLLQKRLRRGNIQVSVGRAGEEPPTAFSFDAELARRAVAELRRVAGELQLEGSVQMQDLLQVPGLFSHHTAKRSSRVTMPAEVRTLIDQAIDALILSRQEEGRRTSVAMCADLDEMERLAAAARERSPAVVEAYRERLQARIHDLLAGSGHTPDEKVLLHEVALFADRVDIGEELQRLDAHVTAMRDLLAQGGVLGRRLEFLLQETLREANTLGAKSPDVALSHLAVDLKSAVERLKEQAANLE